MDTLIRSSTPSRLAAVAALAATLLLLAAPGSALADPDETAFDLRRAAMVLANDGHLVEAADHLVRTAAQLAAGDPEKDDNLRLAARLYHHAGELDASWRTMVNAGVVAYRSGEGERAAHDLVDATVVAVQAGNARRAWDTAQKVGYVLRTTDLRPGERLAILERVRIQGREAGTS